MVIPTCRRQIGRFDSSHLEMCRVRALLFREAPPRTTLLYDSYVNVEYVWLDRNKAYEGNASAMHPTSAMNPTPRKWPKWRAIRFHSAKRLLSTVSRSFVILSTSAYKLEGRRTLPFVRDRFRRFAETRRAVVSFCRNSRILRSTCWKLVCSQVQRVCKVPRKNLWTWIV